jgi:plastocyanin
MRNFLASLGLVAITSLGAVALLTSCSGTKSGYVTSPPTGKELDSGDFGNGGTYSHRFAAAGSYAYHCIHHAAMTGTVEVNASATDTLANVSITSATMAFPAASVKPGGRVVWTNNTALIHTVTSN